MRVALSGSLPRPVPAGPARPLTPERPRPHTPRTPPGPCGRGRFAHQLCGGAPAVKGLSGGFAGGLVSAVAGRWTRNEARSYEDLSRSSRKWTPRRTHGNLRSLRLSAASSGIWRTWDVPSYENNDDGTGWYKTTWLQRYYSANVETGCEAYCRQFADDMAKKDADQAYENCMIQNNDVGRCNDLWLQVYLSSYDFWYDRCVQGWNPETGSTSAGV